GGGGAGGLAGGARGGAGAATGAVSPLGRTRRRPARLSGENRGSLDLAEATQALLDVRRALALVGADRRRRGVHELRRPPVEQRRVEPFGEQPAVEIRRDRLAEEGPRRRRAGEQRGAAQPGAPPRGRARPDRDARPAV